MPSDLGAGLAFVFLFDVGLFALLLFLAWLEKPADRRSTQQAVSPPAVETGRHRAAAPPS
jgi:hypothetical protein